MNVLILASGGDGAGMNACLNALYKNLKLKHNVYTCEGGYCGLIAGKISKADENLIKQNANSGGIIIKTSRCKQFREKQGIEKAYLNLKKHKIDVLIVLGGNGSLRGAMEISLAHNVKVLFIPCTIDNDVDGTDYTIGHDTAVYNCTNFINHVDVTMKSFNRTCVYEAMGRECPKIADEVAKNVNADYVFDSEKSTIEKCVASIKKSLKTNAAPIIILRENLIDIALLRKNLESKLGVDVRTCVVGYVQRGGNPTKLEVKHANSFAKKCCELVNKGEFNNMIVYKNGKFCQSSIFSK